MCQCLRRGAKTLAVSSSSFRVESLVPKPETRTPMRPSSSTSTCRFHGKKLN